jgi:hypothetical protein
MGTVSVRNGWWEMGGRREKKISIIDQTMKREMSRYRNALKEHQIQSRAFFLGEMIRKQV